MVTETRTDVAIHLEGVSKSYGEGEVAVHAVRDIDLQVAAGEFVVILGAQAVRARPRSSISSAGSRRS